VLGKPPAHGFNLTVYILPPLILIAGIGTLLLLLPKWRRRSQANAKARTAIPEPSIATADAHRLDEELRRYGG
jgi:cytochrome c-type biogenesis protein CcmH/NrfF